jgi:hypothetical protein
VLVSGSFFRAWLVWLAIATAALAAAWPWVALPAVVVVLLATVISDGRKRRLVGGLGGALALVGVLRFIVEVAVPNIILAGQRTAEERAVSRLRELVWAEEQVRAHGWIDSDGDGRGELGFLGELSGSRPARAGVAPDAALLRASHFVPLSDGRGGWVFRAEGYLYALALPDRAGRLVGEGGAADPAARRWVAFAWPAQLGQGGRRAFAIDQDERICETDNRQGYSGPEHGPAPEIAQAPPVAGAPTCAHLQDGGAWRPWKKKRPRAPAPSLPTSN